MVIKKLGDKDQMHFYIIFSIDLEYLVVWEFRNLHFVFAFFKID